MVSTDKLKKDFEEKVKKIESMKKLEQLKIDYLGRNGLINNQLQNIKNLPAFQKKEFGIKINELKNTIIRLTETKQKELLNQTDKSEYVDITLPGKKYSRGSLHPVTYAIEELNRIFSKIGFIRMTYPEVEWEYYAFDALNMPKNHPARDDFESLFIEFAEEPKMGGLVLSPHTSSGQVREMLRLGSPPIRMINIAKCYRRNWDATHAPMFYQFEGLCVDKGINITNLKGTIEYFAKEFFGEDRQIRLRPHHFQFTEPSFETDVSCNICGGTGEINGKKCRVCKAGWLELGGCGMVHPNVLRAGKIDPEIYSGWAFGFGPERCLMMKLGLSEIRDLYSGDIRFLSQF